MLFLRNNLYNKFEYVVIPFVVSFIGSKIMYIQISTATLVATAI